MVNLMLKIVRWGEIRFGVAGTTSNYVYQKVSETAWRCINSGMGAVDTDSFLSESEEGSLLGIPERQGLQAAEYGWI
jgi:hypothetical protein